MKFLVVLVVVILGVWLWRSNRVVARKDQDEGMVQASRRSSSQQIMVSCAHCGVHLPQAEALPSPDGLGGAPWFCSVEHRKLGSKQT